MGHVDERDADLALDPLELELERLAQLQVERAERLVEQQHLGREHERPRERDALLLAAAELRRARRARARRARRARASRATRPRDLVAAHAPLAQPERDVLEHVEVREQRVVLEDGVDRSPVRAQPRDVAAVRPRSCRRSARRARRSSAASSSCRSRSARSARRTRRRRPRRRCRRPRARRRSCTQIAQAHRDGRRAGRRRVTLGRSAVACSLTTPPAGRARGSRRRRVGRSTVIRPAVANVISVISISAAPIALTSGVTCRRIIPSRSTETGSAFEPPRNCETITSSNEKLTASSAATSTAGISSGNVTRRNTRQRLAPRSAAASSSDSPSVATRAWMITSRRPS